MASTVKPLYGTSGVAFTITLASLANSSSANVGRQSTVIDNTTNLFLDALVGGFIKSGASGVSTSGVVYIYAFGTSNGGTNYTENAGASDAAITMTNPPNAPLLGSFNMVANATSYKFGPYAVASAFGGTLPDHWGIIIVNASGAALDATAGNHSVWYQGYQAQIV